MEYNDGIKLGSDKVWDSEDRAPWENARYVEMCEPNLIIIRVALLQHDAPYGFMYDCSYILGMVGDEHVYVISPFDYWDRRTWKTDLISWGRRNDVYIKKLEIFDGEKIRWGV